MNPTKEELQLLLSSGWYRLPDPLLCMFTKEYPTAVGIKGALITLWFKATPVEGINTHYVANYESEGRNVLSTCSYYVGKFEEYLKGIDQCVDQSYARKLFLKGVSNG